ncbi:PRC-barrel domain-containing protein [Neobacillus sp. LXY-4]|uniref:PRC-barrel domain-containing protein n=1 Tax=Neobacillus sp. LXY-4 TaxID=3379826 RepID=UPI003EDEEAFC
MRTFSLVKGLPVFELNSGYKLGEVCDLSISGDGKVEGLLIKKKTLFNKLQLIKIENIYSFGTDGIMIKRTQALEPVLHPPEYTIEHQRGLTGKLMMSAEGERLGLVEDVYFMEELGTIVGYECTDGFFSDIKEGKRVVKTAHPPAIGKDAIIVNVESR